VCIGCFLGPGSLVLHQFQVEQVVEETSASFLVGIELDGEVQGLRHMTWIPKLFDLPRS
jgi:hypothetical protein